jgi:hypothetical protein
MRNPGIYEWPLGMTLGVWFELHHRARDFIRRSPGYEPAWCVRRSAAPGQAGQSDLRTRGPERACGPHWDANITRTAGLLSATITILLAVRELR